MNVKTKVFVSFNSVSFYFENFYCSHSLRSCAFENLLLAASSIRGNELSLLKNSARYEGTLGLKSWKVCARRRFSAWAFLDTSISSWFDLCSFLMFSGSPAMLCMTFCFTKGDRDVICLFSSLLSTFLLLWIHYYLFCVYTSEFSFRDRTFRHFTETTSFTIYICLVTLMITISFGDVKITIPKVILLKTLSPKTIFVLWMTNLTHISILQLENFLL